MFTGILGTFDYNVFKTIAKLMSIVIQTNKTNIFLII